jgi:CheY-like chemotaxis protein
LDIGTVLIIDDEADIRSFLRAVFEHWGFSVITADGGAAGIALANEQEPTLILLDLNMPGMTGFQTARKIRKCAKIAKIPILAVTALEKSENRDEAHMAGCNAVVSKPIDRERLHQAVVRLIGQWQQ